MKLFAVCKKGIGIKLRDLHNALVLPAGALEHLILSCIRIGGKMPHIGDIHDPQHIIPRIAQVFFQHIFHNVGTQIPNVGKMVDRGPAGVHLHLSGFIGHEFFFFQR